MIPNHPTHPDLEYAPLQDMSSKYSDLLARVAAGTKSYGERLSESRELDNFLMRRDREGIKEEFPVTDKVRSRWHERSPVQYI